MNKKMIAYILGLLMFSEAGLMIFPIVVALVYHEQTIGSFLVTIAALVIGGLILYFLKPKNKTLYARDGFYIVSLGWIVLSIFGALPFYISKEIPKFIDALFEPVSGFTTTGASILSNVEGLSRSMLFWRSFTHWVGGMGVLVFIMAVLPLASGGGNIHLMRAESPGPDVGKLVPKSISTARILYGIYLGMTIVEIILLLCGGMPLFDSLTLSFGTAGTGGFGIKNDSIGGYSTYCQSIIAIFMTLFGINFNMYFFLLCGKIKDVFKNEELRTYLAIMFSSAIIIALNIYHMAGSVFSSFHTAFFQVSSVMTTTGYSTADFNQWPELSRAIMLIVMCIGGCAGSTGGGFKVSRFLILVKSAKKELKKLSHPRSVNVVTLDGKRISDDVLKSTNVYFCIYIIIFIVSFLIVSADSFDMVTNLSAVVATLNNIGPGLGRVGATGNFGSYTVLSKLIFISDMLLGRLEIFPLILMFMPGLRTRSKKS
ncbi:MAG: TrkH family potassium uptake protein [Ruminococcus sp.]|nr:TrkH family potassium uptake protein [Candidatus Copronaster equi]